MSRRRFLRRAAFTAAVGGVLYAATTGDPSNPRPPLLAGGATGHLALVRAHPGLRDLNSLLSPGAFLVDATQALLSCAIRTPPYHRALLRHGRDYIYGHIVTAKSEGDERREAWARLYLAILDARDGDLDGALDACLWLAAEHPGDTAPFITAAALCHMLGRPEEGARWLGAVPNLSESDKMYFMEDLVTARLGCPPRAMAGADAEKLAAAAALVVIETTMWSKFNDADLPERLQVLASMVFLRRVVANFGKDHALEDAIPS